MGSDLHLIVTANTRHLEELVFRGLAMIYQLEALWSRFDPDSEVSRLNASSGRPLMVSDETILLVERAVEGWRRTEGLFDPTLLQAVVAAGYDRDFQQLDGASTASPGLVRGHAHDQGFELVSGPRLEACPDEILIDRDAHTISVPAGVGLDPGGLGKGLAADLVAEALMDWGAEGALVNLGGDLRCTGRGPGIGSWVVAVPGPDAGDCGAGGTPGDTILELSDGGVATSTSLRRRWRTSSGVAHHLIDPTTGRSASRAARSVTVLAATGCDAEILATAIAADGGLPTDPALIGGASVMLTDHCGSHEVAGPIDRFRRC